MDRFLNAVKGRAAALDRPGAAAAAIVTSVDPRDMRHGSVFSRGLLTGWLPILTAWMGAGWGMVCPPQPGDQVLVLAQEGDAENGVIVGASFSDRARAPVANPRVMAEACWGRHPAGQ
jgi:uncharacterized protein involved in type VI secretion and phage assembly